MITKTVNFLIFLILFLFSNSRLQMFFKIGILKNFPIFAGKHLCWSLILIKLQVLSPTTLLKKDSNAGVFCEICKILKNAFFYRIPLVATSEHHGIEHAN